jgi:hypothetical protein
MIPSSVIRVAYAVYVVALLLSQVLLLAVPGRKIPIYACLGIISSVSVFCENRKLRLWGAPFICLAMILVMYDYYGGIRYERDMSALKQQIYQRGNAPATQPNP